MMFLVMVTGRHPFKSSNQSDWQAEKVAGLDISRDKYPELSNEQISVIRRALSPRAEDRHSSSQEFVIEHDVIQTKNIRCSHLSISASLTVMRGAKKRYR